MTAIGIARVVSLPRSAAASSAGPGNHHDLHAHVARKGVSGITSPLDLLNDVTAAEIQGAVDATRGLPRMA